MRPFYLSVVIGMLMIEVPGLSASDGRSDSSVEGRTIVLERMVPQGPATVFQLWVTKEGVQRFLSPDAYIEPRVGGAYTIIFDPLNDPAGEAVGTKGATILNFQPANALSFEWIPFVARDGLGPNLPPYIPKPERDRKPLPTWVELTFTGAGEGHTRVTLRHSGFKDGAVWDTAFAYFRDRAWPLVLDRLVTYTRDGVSPAWTSDRPQRVAP